ncbi:Glycerol-3-phosphate transporter [Symmachiella macrocystis]|uniref:Glycerol-3-phosphate transporter n=1 Tax=Symmachiella macrocystis TaxID=2527985 RepID=A0A5C6BWD4_9PLAN|nr:MFS transporter [Symmachiella macrocystis]TWU14959.1 Glycerol-3-phosphate transporter [Symmachiella macrocystis]
MAKRSGEDSVVWLIWLTYGVFYFCRTNLSVALPGMQMPVEDGGLGLSKDQIGYILGGLKLAYAFGQLLNGQLSEKISPRVLLALGMFGSAGLNVLFGFGTGLYFLIFVWACNGYCQSLGWTPCVRVLGNWVPVLRRGKAIGIVGTGYQITLGLTYVIAGAAVTWYGNWRGALFLPAAILAGTAVIMLLFLRESPTDDDDDLSVGTHVRTDQSFVENLQLTVSNFALWRLGLALGLLNACRYGFLDWGITHLLEMQEAAGGSDGLSKVTLKYGVIAIGAAAGSYLAGWATDRFFGGRRAPVISFLLLMLAGLTVLYEFITRVQSAYTVECTMGLLVVIGFCIYGPQVLLVGTAPADLAKRGTAAAAAGFVNFMGYLGAFGGDTVTGWVAEHFNWQVALYTWAGWALLAAVVSATLWNAGGNSHAKANVVETEN